MKPKPTFLQILLYAISIFVLVFAVLFVIVSPFAKDWTMGLFGVGAGLPAAWWLYLFHTRPATAAPVAPAFPNTSTWNPPMMGMSAADAGQTNPYAYNPFEAPAAPKRKKHWGPVWAVALVMMMVAVIAPSPDDDRDDAPAPSSTPATMSSSATSSAKPSKTSSSKAPSSSSSSSSSSSAPTSSSAAAPTTEEPTPEATTDLASPFASCAEARAAGAAPLHRGDAGYSPELDRDGDGVACENVDADVNPAPAPAPLEPVQQAGVPDNQMHGFFAPPAPVEEPDPAPAPAPVYVKNCREARALGIAPMYAGSPGYSAALDKDKDGVACE